MFDFLKPQSDYLFIAECLNGRMIKQTPDDKSMIDSTKSAFYDVVQNLPVKSFSLIGKGHIFMVDFRDLTLHEDGKVIKPKTMPPADAKISLVYWKHTIQVSQRKLQIDKTLITNLVKRFWETKHHATVKAGYTIGWEAFVHGKKFNDFTMRID